MVEPVSTSLMVPYAVSSLTASLNSFVSGHFNRQESRIARWENFAFQEGLESQRQQLQLAQMKLSVLQRRENEDFQRELAQQNREFQKEIEEFRQSVNIAIHQSNLNFQKWRFEQEKHLQVEILEKNQVFQREINKVQHQNVLEQIRERIRNERENPIVHLASDLLEAPFLDGVMPLKILLSPPELDYDASKPQGSGLKIESFLAEEIRQFLKQGYDINSKERPTQLLDKAWSSKRFGGGSALHSLHKQLKTIPVLILESEFVDNYINLRCCYWDGEQNNLVEDSILSRYPYRDLLYDLAKSRAKEWRKTKTELLQDEFDEATLKTLAKGFDEENLAILEKEEQIIAKVQKSGRDIGKLNLGKSYRLSKEDYDAFHDYLAVLHCLAIGTINDILALRRSYNLQPLLPELLTSLLSKLNSDAQTKREAIKPIIAVYRNFYQGIEKQADFSSLVPNLTIDFALSLADLSDKSFAVEEAKYSVAVWLKQHGIELDKIFDLNSDEDCQLLKSIIYQEDEIYLTKLQQLVDKVGDTPVDLVQIKSLVDGWQNLKRWGDGIPSMSDLEEPEAEVNNESKETEESGLSTFSFETVTVDEKGEIIKKEKKQAKYFREYLPGGVEIEMVYIPGGTFRRGSNHHRVWIAPFYMSRYPITQAQWRAVTSLPKTGQDLNPEPSGFNNDSLPVERISWDDAVEFCNRLTRDTGNYYRLPSEAQWEYACRAGTTTPFCFGEILTKELANYCSEELENRINRRIIKAGDEISLAKKYNLGTTPVGTFPANAFGLYDMHGNVFEWCADTSHHDWDYKLAPVDGSIWLEYGDEKGRVLKGGSWMHEANDCASNSFENAPASGRIMEHNPFNIINFLFSFVGFRIISILPNL
jgi:formylglycine-generating enzyme required for sulfatase activity